MQTKHAITLVVAGILYEAGQVLIVRRGPTMSGAGSWEFPGGKVEPGESETAALARELKEELTLEVSIEEFLSETVHSYPAKTIRLRFYWARPRNPKESIVLTEHDAMKWLRPTEIDLQMLSEADRSVVSLITTNPRMKMP